MPVAAHAPTGLIGEPFIGSRAVAEGLLTENQLRSKTWKRLLRGVYVHTSVDITDDVRVRALRLVLPANGVATGLLAAWLHGLWSPLPGRQVPLDVSLPVAGFGDQHAGQSRRRLTFRTEDAFGEQIGYSKVDGDVVELNGLSVTSPLRTCFDLMRERRLVEAVVVADAFLQQGLAHWLLAAYCEDRGRWPGIRAARMAVSLARPGSRSPGETRLRMVVVLAGFPEPWINVPVVDSFGNIVGIPDLTVPVSRPVGLEYDGEYHEEADQQVKDRRRSNRLTTIAGLPLLRYDRVAVTQERRTIIDEVRRATGLRPTVLLDDSDFWRPSRARAW